MLQLEYDDQTFSSHKKLNWKDIVDSNLHQEETPLVKANEESSGKDLESRFVELPLALSDHEGNPIKGQKSLHN